MATRILISCPNKCFTQYTETQTVKVCVFNDKECTKTYLCPRCRSILTITDADKSFETGYQTELCDDITNDVECEYFDDENGSN